MKFAGNAVTFPRYPLPLAGGKILMRAHRDGATFTLSTLMFTTYDCEFS